MLACASRSRCCVIYVFRLISLCDRFMQHNIEHLGYGEHQSQSAYRLCMCTDVASFTPSTVSFNVVKEPWHMHLTNTDRCLPCQAPQIDSWHLAKEAERVKGSTVWAICTTLEGVLVCACVACQTQWTPMNPLILINPYSSWHKNPINPINPYFCLDYNIK